MKLYVASLIALCFLSACSQSARQIVHLPDTLDAIAKRKTVNKADYSVVLRRDDERVLNLYRCNSSCIRNYRNI
jgi:hypothetical protein